MKKNYVVVPVSDSEHRLYVPVSKRELEYQNRYLSERGYEFYELVPDISGFSAYWRIRKKNEPNNL